MAQSVTCTPGRRHRPRSPRRLAAAATLLTLLGIVTSARAQSTPLSIEVEPSSDVSRTGGPISLALRFDWRGSGILEGQLRIELRNEGNDLLGTCVLNDLYLTEGVTRQEVMLSGINVYSTEVVLDFWLLDESGRTVARLRPGLLRIPRYDRRSLAVAVIRSDASARGNAIDVADKLRLEAMLPEYKSGRDSIIATRTLDLSPDDAPADPLRFCTYDMVLLTADGFSRLIEQQLEALLAWVRAGGAICLLADDRGLDAPQIDFLNALLDREDDNPAFLLNSSGRLVYGVGEDVPGPLTSRCGLGRAAIVGLDGSSADASAGHWPETSAFLWRLRQEHLASVANSGLWDIGATIRVARQFAGDQFQNAYGWQQNNDAFPQTSDALLQMQATEMNPVPINGGAGLVARLLPGDIRVVPLWMIGMVLAAYVLAIGPLDYFVLGRLGLRRLTWISFPAVTLIFTLCSIAVSNSFLSAAGERRFVVIRDLDQNGVVTRENRLELLFPSRTRTMQTELARGLFCALRHQDFSRTGFYFNPYTSQDWGQTAAGPAWIDGRMPARTTISQQIGQWTPQLNRVFTIPLTDPPDEFAPLADPQLDELVRTGADGGIVQRLRATAGRLVGVYLYTQDSALSLLGPRLLFQDNYGQQFTRVYVNNQWTTRQADFLQELSARQQPGFFAVVSQIAPTGGYRFEDMALLDPTDPRQRLLVVAVEEDNHLVLYRKLYVLDD